MAITLTNAESHGERPNQPVFMHRATVLFDTAYPTGGETLGLSSILPDGANVIFVAAEHQAGYDFVYDYANDKLKAIDMATDAEVTNATNLSAVTAVIFVIAY